MGTDGKSYKYISTLNILLSFRCQNRLPFEQGRLGTWNQKRSIQNPCPTSQKEKRGRRLCPKTLHFGHLRPSRLLQGAQDCQR